MNPGLLTPGSDPGFEGPKMGYLAGKGKEKVFLDPLRVQAGEEKNETETVKQEKSMHVPLGCFT